MCFYSIQLVLRCISLALFLNLIGRVLELGPCPG
jgi:hypothetical protein